MDVLRRILSYLNPYARRLTIGYLALFVAMAMQLLVPRLVEYVIDRGIAAQQARVVVLGTLGIIGVGVLNGGFTFARSYLFQWLAERVSYDMRNELYAHMQRLSFSYHDQAHTGQLMSRATEDINSVRRFLMFSLRSLVQSVGTVVVVAIILLLSDWRLALLSLAVVPVLTYSAVHFGRTVRPKFLGVQQQFGVMTNSLQENLAGARVVRAFAREEEEIERFDRDLQGLYDRQMDAVKQYAFYFPLMTLLSSVGLAVVLWYGGRLVLRGDLTIGGLTAFYLYLALLGQPVRLLGWVVNSMARALASGERIFEVLDTAPAIRTPNEPGVPDEYRGRVAFRDVVFRYPGADVPALQGISFVAEPGQRVALIGTTGSGKSTVTALIPRFYDVTSGSVEVDDLDVRAHDLLELRRNVGIVLQDTFLFSVTIGENIAYGRPDATRDEIIRAARAARIHDFIAGLPDGYDTMVGERGVSLSGGQKQRIAIARALVMNPRILILDDATSSVDTETEHEIQLALQQLMERRTTFVIAHRLLSLKQADLILVLDHGRIVERGTHESLLAQPGIYWRIYELQLKEQEDLISTLAGDDVSVVRS